MKGLTKNIAKLIGQIPKDAKIIPGHGPLSGIRELKAYHAMLVETTRIVRGANESGQNPRPDSGGGTASKIRKPGNGVYFDETLDRNGFQQPGRKEIRRGSS